ncbi:MAG: MarR family transcriptional regulator [Candidatus Nitrosocaldus sp.]|nr:MarR family transcriptional regulator [Candidatus Nitrosocaldus sp.]MCS7141469.1 MarR family transcriptional regulator [Candidatus Nitrosocaldus sp.]MDW7999675.1 MarR family transcriptional regulator [Candidatus Nitrosocaldus sp.]MDW8275329.1 MarR family transcriptional regulator [Candidatus Nitrosocaldus sp.]
MRVTLVASEHKNESDGMMRSILSTLSSMNVRVDILSNMELRDSIDSDIVLVTGGDKGILQYFHKLAVDSPPVLGMYEEDSTGFLAQVDVRDLAKVMGMVSANRYRVEEVTRLAVKVDGRDVEPVLNDVALFPSKSATLMEYRLRINGDDVWHDKSDGIIISTPIGSTAYSMSAGGPIVLRNAKVFVVVPVNSMDVTRRPLVVNDDVEIEVSEIISRYRCEVILDGGMRVTVRRTLNCYRYPYPARFVRLEGYTPASLLAKKVKLAEDMLGMPPSAKLVLKTLEYEGPMSQRDLIARTMLPARTLRLALNHLIRKGYVKRRSSLRDARQKIYELRI